LVTLYKTGFSYAEMASVVELNPASVGKTLTRAIDKLSKWVQQQLKHLTMRTNNKCANDWVIQAYINGELDTDEILEFKNHLKICSSCSPRLADRRRRVANVLVLIEELETNPISNRKHKNVPLARVFAATASIAIVFGFLRCYVN